MIVQSKRPGGLEYKKEKENKTTTQRGKMTFNSFKPLHLPLPKVKKLSSRVELSSTTYDTGLTFMYDKSIDRYIVRKEVEYKPGSTTFMQIELKDYPDEFNILPILKMTLSNQA